MPFSPTPFSDMVNAGMAHVNASDALSSAQASLSQASSLGLGSSTIASLQSQVSSAAASMTASASSLFKNPIGDHLSDINSLTGTLGNIPGMSSLTGSLTTLASNAQTNMCSRLAAVTSDVPVMMAAKGIADQAANIDAVTSGIPPSDPTILDSAFPKTSAPCPGVDLQTAFAPLTQAKGMFDSAMTNVLGSFSSALGTTFSSVSDLTSHLASTIGSSIPDPSTGINHGLAALQGAIGSVQGAVSSVVNTLHDDFTTLCQGAEQAVKDGISLIRGASAVNMLNHTDPCVQNVMKAVVNPATVDHAALEHAENPTTAAPIQIAVTKVQDNYVVPKVDDGDQSQKMVPRTDTDKYTYDEIEAMRATMNAQKDKAVDLQKQAAIKMKAVEQYKQDNDYSKKRVAAGVLPGDDPTPTTTDQAAAAAWNAIIPGFLVVRDDYNAFINNVSNPELLKYNAMVDELAVRKLYGRHPYTSRERECGVTTKPDNQTTFLDSGI